MDGSDTGAPDAVSRSPRELARYIRAIPDFPTRGILFRDIMPLLRHGPAFGEAIRALARRHQGARPDAVVSIESRGLIFGSAMAYELGVGVVPVRKAGKLPHKTYRATYALEYGTDALEVHRDAIRPGDHVLIVDDLLATGGTASACARLARDLGATVAGAAFVVELEFLGGRAKLEGIEVFSLLKYSK